MIYDDQATPFSLDRTTARWTGSPRSGSGSRRGREPDRPAAAGGRPGRVLPARRLRRSRRPRTCTRCGSAEFTNILYAAQGRAATNDLADEPRPGSPRTRRWPTYYNNELAGGKWKDFQTQPHIGYGDVARYGPNAPWQQPELNNVALPGRDLPRRAADPGAGGRRAWAWRSTARTEWWPAATAPAVLPTFSPYQSQPRAVHRGVQPGRDRRSTTASRRRRRGCSVDRRTGPGRQAGAGDDRRGLVPGPEAARPRCRSRSPAPDGAAVEVAVDGRRAGAAGPGRPEGLRRGERLRRRRRRALHPRGGRGRLHWQRIPGIGRDGAGMEPLPVTAPRRTPGGDGPRLEYDVNLLTTGPGHRLGVPVAAQHGPAAGRADATRSRSTATPRRSVNIIDGHRRRRHDDEPAVGTQHLRQREPHGHHAHHRRGRARTGSSSGWSTRPSWCRGSWWTPAG